MPPFNPALPRIWCDFNAVGLGDEQDDPCFYSFGRGDVAHLSSLVGCAVVLYQEDTDTDVTACTASVETFREGWRGEPFKSVRYCGFRARPHDGTWFSGLATAVLSS